MYADQQPLVPDLQFKVEIHELADKYGLSSQDEQLIFKIGMCESGGKQNARQENITTTAEGVREVWSTDVGIMQINDYYHLRESLQMGLYITQERDNIEFGVYLYKKSGTKPWKASKACWDR